MSQSIPSKYSSTPNCNQKYQEILLCEIARHFSKSKFNKYTNRFLYCKHMGTFPNLSRSLEVEHCILSVIDFSIVSIEK